MPRSRRSASIQLLSTTDERSLTFLKECANVQNLVKNSVANINKIIDRSLTRDGSLKRLQSPQPLQLKKPTMMAKKIQ
jgi:hypothetical protein